MKDIYKKISINNVQKIPSSEPKAVRRQLQLSPLSLSLVIENRETSQSP